MGGSLDLPPGLSAMARCDYYCGWYHVHSRRPGGEVPNHPPGNLSVRREVFARTRGFTEQQPVAYAHEELAWQAEVRRAGGRIMFDPRAIVFHYNRPGFANLLRRNYRWGFSAIESKAPTGAARQAWIYRYPGLLVAGSLPLALASTAVHRGLLAQGGRLRATPHAARRSWRPGWPTRPASRRAGSVGSAKARTPARCGPAGNDRASGRDHRHLHPRPAGAPRTSAGLRRRARRPRPMKSWSWTTRRLTARPASWSRAGFPASATWSSPSPVSTSRATVRWRRRAGTSSPSSTTMRSPRRAGPTRCGGTSPTPAWWSAPAGSSRSALETEGQRLFEANGGFSRGSARVRLPDDAARPLHGRSAPLIAWAISVGCGCSYAVRRDAARALGGFDEALDLGAVLPGGGDHDLLWRALQSGGTRGLRAGSARVARAPPRGRRRRTTRSSATSERCSRFWASMSCRARGALRCSATWCGGW